MSLAYYYSLLSKKQHQLERLQTCDSDLHNHQQEFLHYKKNVTDPELSQDNWQGHLADAFDDIRTGEMTSSYHHIQNTQFNNIFSLLNEKIRLIQDEIKSIKQTIAALEAQAAAELNKQ
ncbi:YwqH-like family protein [Metabacillus fastidiosus]|uniref:YwqH-like family protein n=1 Tax=Metabacillus fastidiosus TaxID=1458 RepID=UPI003D2DC85E